MSVSTTLATVYAYGYTHCYRVDGDVIGYGSDGEPVLVNVRPIGPMLDAGEAIDADERRERTRAAVQAVAEATGLGAEMVLWLAYR